MAFFGNKFRLFPPTCHLFYPLSCSLCHQCLKSFAIKVKIGVKKQTPFNVFYWLVLFVLDVNKLYILVICIQSISQEKQSFAIMISTIWEVWLSFFIYFFGWLYGKTDFTSKTLVLFFILLFHCGFLAVVWMDVILHNIGATARIVTLLTRSVWACAFGDL